MSAKPKLPSAAKHAIIIAVTLSLLPPVLIARARLMKSPKPRIHIFQDMDHQPKLKAQSWSNWFEDERSMRPPVAGTVARGELAEDNAYYRGRFDDEPLASESESEPATTPEPKWLDELPSQVKLTNALLRRGQQRYVIYCAPCHGEAGYGDGMVSRRVATIPFEQLQGTKWVQPTSLHDEAVRARPMGYLFDVITHGVRTMPAYGPQISVEDRWAVSAYIQAMQLSQSVHMDELPQIDKERLPTP